MPQLKIYEAKEFRDSWLPHDTRELLGARPGQGQGTWYIVAHTAVEAVEIAQRAGVPHADSPRHLRVGGTGKHVGLLKASGYLARQGEVIAHSNKGGTADVAKFTDNGWLVIGHFEYDHRTRDTVFSPEEG